MAHEMIEVDADPDSNTYRKKLVYLDNDLTTENIKSLKFLSLDFIPAARLEKIINGTDLFELLEHAGLLGNGNYYFLAECLDKIGRKDLSEYLLDSRILNVAIEKTGSKIPPHRCLLYDLGEDLDRDEVKLCLYYYGDMPKARKRAIESGVDFFTYLEQVKKIDSKNLNFLEDLLKTIERNDLVKMIKEFRPDGKGELKIMPKPTIPYYTPATKDYTDDNVLKSKDLEKPASSDNIETAIPEIHLQQEQYIKPASLDTCISMPLQVELAYQVIAQPQSIERFGKALGLTSNDLQEIAKNNDTRDDMKVITMMNQWFQQTDLHEEEKVEHLINAFDKSGLHELSSSLKTLLHRKPEVPASSPNKLDDNRLPEIVDEKCAHSELPLNSNMLPSHTDDHENLYTSTGEARLLQPGEDNIYIRTRLEEAAPSHNDVVEAPPMLPMYPMNHLPRGLCIIINNEHFTYDPNNRMAKVMNNRIGSSIDRDAVFKTFLGLGFEVYDHNNIPSVDMVRRLTEYSLMDHENYDCFVCVILSHGTRDHIYGADGVAVPIRELTGPFKTLSCPKLGKKPKLFFIQACQGQEKQYGRDIERDAVPGGDLFEDAPPRGELIPNEQDFLLGMATIPGFVSYRSKSSGSWYITKLCETLNDYAHHWDILHILTKVNQEVGRANADLEGQILKQTPAPWYTLSKRVIFKKIGPNPMFG